MDIDGVPTIIGVQTSKGMEESEIIIWRKQRHQTLEQVTPAIKRTHETFKVLIQMVMFFTSLAFLWQNITVSNLDGDSSKIEHLFLTSTE